METILDKAMHHYFTQLNEPEKKSVVDMLKTFLKGREKKSESVSIEQYNDQIDTAITRVEAGEFFTQSEVEKISKDW